MKPLALGALLGLLLVVFGVPLAPAAAVLAQPVVLGFAAGVLARPYLTRGRTT